MFSLVFFFLEKKNLSRKTGQKKKKESKPLKNVFHSVSIFLLLVAANFKKAMCLPFRDSFIQLLSTLLDIRDSRQSSCSPILAWQKSKGKLRLLSHGVIKRQNS